MRPFWVLSKELLRYRHLVALSLIMALTSGLSLGVGMLGARPVLETILGKGKGLPELAQQFNDRIAAGPEWTHALKLSDATITRLPADPFTALAWILGGLCVLAMLGAGSTFLQAYLSQTVVNRSVTTIRRKAFRAVLSSPLLGVVREGPVDLISRIVNDSNAFAQGLTVLLSRTTLQVIKGAAGLSAALIFNWLVTLCALTVVPLLYTVIRRLGKRINRASRGALASQSGLLGAATQALQALRVVKTQGAEGREAGRFHRVNQQMLRELNRIRTAKAIASPLTEMLTIFLLCGLVLVAGKAIIAAKVDPTDFILAIAALAVAGSSLKPLTGLINDVQAAVPAAERLLDVVHRAPEPGRERTLASLPRHAREITFDDVSVRYPGADKLSVDHLSLRVSHGMRLAVVGPNGCGKTTLLSLLPRLFDPESGVVAVDGVDIRSVSLRSLRAQIGVVTQDVVLFKTSLADNIAYGVRGCTREQIIDAARRARAHDFISRLPEGYDTVLAEQGATLSGGQRQRIAIARAILRDPAILILDEATSMIDAESEAGIAQAIADFSRGRTTLIVAHRLSTVRTCDAIAVMDHGRLIDLGTHDELLQRCELYRSLSQHQLA
jgi:ABC-type multidrug transport system fused ATPase/permease subunit